jgi:hypothetical protein
VRFIKGTLNGREGGIRIRERAVKIRGEETEDPKEWGGGERMKGKREV